MGKNNSQFATHNSQFNKIAIFQKKEIRKTIHNDEWWFVIEDIIFALTDSKNPRGYIKDMRRRDAELAKGWVQIATPLPIETAGGAQKINCANTERIFRIIQSIPSPKADPFKRWFAKVGYERVQKIEDPEFIRSVAIVNTIRPTVSVESFRQYFGSVIKHLADQFELGWSHYVTLQTIRSTEGRKFYEIEAIENSWSVRELQRQINSSLYERLALSSDKTVIMNNHNYWFAYIDAFAGTGYREEKNNIEEIDENPGFDGIHDPGLKLDLPIEQKIIEDKTESVIYL